MSYNYLKTAIRNILKYKVHSFIKIFGLSIGIAACLFIYLFVVDELSFDRFHQNGDQLFRFIQVHFDKDSKKESSFQEFIPTPVGPELIQSIPDIEHQTRYVEVSGVVRHEEKIFSESLALADTSFFEIFTFPLLVGNPQTVLSEDHNIILSRSHAEKYFGDENPVGKTLTISYGKRSKDYTVSGIMENVPSNSTLQFNMLIHIQNLPMALDNPDILNDWKRWYCPLFVLLQPDVTPERISGKLDQFCQQHFSSMLQKNLDEGYDPFTFGLQPIKDMHLDTRVAGTVGLSTSYLLSAIALAIMLIACVNFMNLSIGSASVRSTEIGVRKILGAGRKQLIWQFWGEALVISLVAILWGLLLTELLIPQFNSFSGKQLSIVSLSEGSNWIALFALTVLTGLAAGSYPAFVMSGFHPVDVLKGKLKIGGNTLLTKGLVVLQFALSVILCISAVILGKQVSLLMNRDPGYISEGLVVILTQENEPQESERLYQRYRNEIISHRQIQDISASNREFGLFLPSGTLEIGGRKIFYRYNRVDPDFLATMKLDLIQGRNFSKIPGSDREALIVNRRLIEQLEADFVMGMPLGESSLGFPNSGQIIGVIEDCHFESMRNEIDPLILFVGTMKEPRRNRFSRIIVRFETGKLKDTMGLLEQAWKKTQPDKPFIYYFQDEALKGLYEREKRWSRIILYASVVSIILACLGIFGLTALSLSRRVKEIGIRKVLGASAGHILYLTSREFVLLISIANVVAWPSVFFIMKRILQNYPYRVDIAMHYFVLAFIASIMIAILTIIYHSLKAALQNPVKSLRHE